MVATVTPERIGGEFSCGLEQSASVPYTVTGATDENDAHAAVLREVPNWRLLPNGNRIEMNNIRLRCFRPDGYEATVSYGTREEDGIDQFNVDFDVAAVSQKITQSLSTVSRYVASGVTEVDYKGALGVTKDGIEGIEIMVPTFTWTVRYMLNASFVNESWIANLMSIVGRTNDAVFRGFAAGTVLQSGISGARSGRENWQLAAKFAASPNVTGVTIGDISGIAKGGWEYLEVHYEELTDDTAFRLYRRPIQVDVHQVYRSADFEDLLIPAG